MSWEQAKAYAAWLSRVTGKPYRLLTEAEWEYAARGVTSMDAPHPAYPWGDTADHEHANYGTEQCCQGKKEGRDQWFTTAPVGSFEPNDFKLHDMQGNVFEWVEDCYPASYNEAPTDGSAASATSGCSRVIRGGSWFFTPQDLRAAYRRGNASGDRDNVLGFRLARTITP